MVVQLPPQPAGGTGLPLQPQNPPTLNDVYNAVEYNCRIHASHIASVATRHDVANGVIYESEVIAEHAGPAVVPLWFAPALAAALPPLLAPLIRVTYINYNLQCDDGLQRPFKIIPFINGDDPTQHLHNLPALNTENDIIALTGHECHDYLVGYQVAVPHTIAARKRAIRLQIGCSVGM